MKKFTVLLLTIFTLTATALFGCTGTQENDIPSDDKVQITKTEEQNEREKYECPDVECPAPRRPHKRHGKKLPRPKPAYIKENKK